METDKKKHMIAGAVLGLLGGGVGFAINLSLTIPFALLFPLVGGAGKELYDIKRTGFDKWDFLATLFGGCLGMGVWSYIVIWL